MARLIEVEGIGEVYAKKLEAAGVRGTNQFLKLGADRQGRKELAEKSGISETLILEWVNHVDLMRIKGVGSEFSDLLEAAGVDTVVELATRNPDNLYERLQAVNKEKRLCRRLPTKEQVAGWIDQAKSLDRVITY